MKHDLELKLQAWLDGELPQDQAAPLGQWIARDSEASALVAELRAVKETLPGNETPRAVPDTREFYWSQIQRRIERETPALRPERAPRFGRWQRYFLALAGVAAAACTLVITLRHAAPPIFDEISSTSDSMEAVTFHDQSGQMTVVWLQDNSPQATPKQPLLKTQGANQDEGSPNVEIQ
jgi:anti-sigma factor RsiW